MLLSEDGAGEMLGGATWPGLLFGTLLGSAISGRPLKTSGDSTSMITSPPVDGVGEAEELEPGSSENGSDENPGTEVLPWGVALSFGGRSWLEAGGSAFGLVLGDLTTDGEAVGEVDAAAKLLLGEMEGLWSLLELDGESKVGDREFGSELS